VRPLIRSIDRLNHAIFRLVSWLTLVMVLVGAFNALARYFDKAVAWRLSSNAWVELQWYLFSLVFLFGAPWALRIGSHVSVDVLYGRFELRTRAWIDLVGGLVFLLPFCIFAIWVSLPSVRDSIAVWESSPDPGGLARWPIKSAVPIAFFLLLLQGIAEVLRRGLFLFKGVSAAELELFADEADA
jgi:TRAP-type mannitol/chloroaromatic compound transport system permease small subunit